MGSQTNEARNSEQVIDARPKNIEEPTTEVVKKNATEVEVSNETMVEAVVVEKNVADDEAEKSQTQGEPPGQEKEERGSAQEGRGRPNCWESAAVSDRRYS